MRSVSLLRCFALPAIILLSGNCSNKKNRPANLNELPQDSIVEHIAESKELEFIDKRGYGFIANTGTIITTEMVDSTASVSGEAIFYKGDNSNSKPIIIVQGKATYLLYRGAVNVRAYSEPAEFTLIWGKGILRPENGIPISSFHPGDMLSLNKDGEVTKKSVDLKEVTLWESGYFSLTRDNVYYFFEQVSELYNLKVKFSETLLSSKVTAIIPHDTSLESMLSFINGVGYHTNINMGSRELTVSNK